MSVRVVPHGGDVFALFTRRRRKVAPLILNNVSDDLPDVSGPRDPEAEVELVSEAMEKLEQVRDLVHRLPELPVGDRQDLLAQLRATNESLRSLCFLDAIY